MYSRIRPLLFRLDPEQAHALTLGLVRLAGMLPPVEALLRRIYRVPTRPVSAFGISFQNPVGLAAGYDKDGLGWRGLACLGFGHIEIGTVTPRSQPGNPKPRIFRLPEDQALINRMGFPGRGSDFVARQLQRKRPPGLVLGINLGKNKDTPLERAAGDYLQLIDVFAPLGDYLAVNVSSPNTPGLRDLQTGQALKELLAALIARRDAIADRSGKRTPLLVKLAPDFVGSGLRACPFELEQAIDVLLQVGLDGVILCNTTLNREKLHSSRRAEPGGLSGRPLKKRSLEMLQQVVAQAGSRLPVISAGGIMTPDDALERLDAGASLVQVYTGLVYAGPALIQQIVVYLRGY